MRVLVTRPAGDGEITSAALVAAGHVPISASRRVQDGPARYWVKSRTRKPSRYGVGAVTTFMFADPGGRCSPDWVSVPAS